MEKISESSDTRTQVSVWLGGNGNMKGNDNMKLLPIQPLFISFLSALVHLAQEIFPQTFSSKAEAQSPRSVQSPKLDESCGRFCKFQEG